MSRDLAHQILDDAKAGRLVSEAAIRQALRVTGDLDHKWPDASTTPGDVDQLSEQS